MDKKIIKMSETPVGTLIEIGPVWFEYDNPEICRFDGLSHEEGMALDEKERQMVAEARAARDAGANVLATKHEGERDDATPHGNDMEPGIAAGILGRAFDDDKQ